MTRARQEVSLSFSLFRISVTAGGRSRGPKNSNSRLSSRSPIVIFPHLLFSFPLSLGPFLLFTSMSLSSILDSEQINTTTSSTKNSKSTQTIPSIKSAWPTTQTRKPSWQSCNSKERRRRSVFLVNLVHFGFFEECAS